MTSYDTIWTEFIANCETDDINLPNTDEKRYNVIQSAKKKYNNRMCTQIVCDDATETISVELDDTGLLLFSYYIRLSLLDNKLIHLATTYSPFAKELGIKNYKDMSNNFEFLIMKTEKMIEEIIINSSEDFI